MYLRCTIWCIFYIIRRISILISILNSSSIAILTKAEEMAKDFINEMEDFDSEGYQIANFDWYVQVNNTPSQEWDLIFIR